ncbi:MAG: DNA-deoxyinosine glycosylase [Steroidobacteraceae bacterium]
MRSSPAERVHAFPPILGARPRLLILGSLPGVASLRAGEYYAHPRNQFWPIMAASFGIARDAPYAQRLAALRAAGVGVWDVLAEASRPGSSDADIDAASARAQDVRGLLLRRRSIAVVAFSGGAACRLFARLVLPTLPAGRISTLQFVTLPSTSPAHAALRPAIKLRRWRRVLSQCGRGP